MKPESAKFAEQADIVLVRGATMLSVGLNEDAARAAYMASFHIAQAYIFERTEKTTKSHRGVQIEFLRLTKDDLRIDSALRTFLSQAYEFKSVADYFTGPNTVTPEEAEKALATSKRFVAHFIVLLTHCGEGPPHEP